MSNEKIDWDKVTVGPVEGEKSEEVVGESAEVATIETQTEKVEQEIRVNTATLNENIARLPEPETVSVDEHPGLRAHLERYKQSILDNRDNFVTGMGLTLAIGSPVMGVMYEAALNVNGFMIMGEAAVIGLLFAAADQAVGRINAYLKTKKYEKEVLAGETN